MTTAYAKLNFQQNKQRSLCFNFFIYEKTFSDHFSSLKEVWVAVINITGPLSNWSFADHSLPGNIKNHDLFMQLLPLPCRYLQLCVLTFSFSGTSIASEVINGGPPSYICRLSGKSNRNWTFWVEVRIPDYRLHLVRNHYSC